jgi:putative methionine-R-sulfoxide reductase with GAF domain
VSDELAAVDRILSAGGDADDILRDVVAVLNERFEWVGIAFVEEDALVLGPSTGDPPTVTTDVPISYEGSQVAELQVAGDADPELLEQVAERIAPFCLVGWDTGGEAWSP